MSFSFHVESDFVWRSSWIGEDFLMAAGASVMATSFSELPAGIDLRMNWQVGEDGFSWPDNRP